MAISKTLQRLLRIRDLEEEDRRRALKAAMAELEALERARVAAKERERAGRAWIGTHPSSEDAVDRQAGLIQAQAAHRRARMLAQRIAASERDAAERRQELLEKRVEREQAAALVEQARVRDGQESNRQSQRAIDDWYGGRKFLEDKDGKRSEDSRGALRDAVPESRTHPR